MKYESYVNSGQSTQDFDNVLFYDIGKEIVYPLGYIQYKLCILNFPISTNFQVFKYFAYYLVLEIDLTNMLNLAIKERGTKIVGKRNTLHVGYIINLQRSFEK